MSTRVHHGVIAAATVAPWTWFWLRDALGQVGDVIAIVLTGLVAGLVVLEALLAGGTRWWLVAAASTLVMGCTAVVGPWLPVPEGVVAAAPGITVASANIMGTAEPVDSLLAASPDVLVIAEMDPGAYPPLARAYPFRTVTYDGPAVAVFSRYPVRVLDLTSPALPGLRVEIEGPAGPFVLYALHVPRPWFTDQGGWQATVTGHHAIMVGLRNRVAQEKEPVVVAGDLNSPDRSRDYRMFAASMVDVMRASPTSWTSTGKWLAFLLRIDHLFVTRGWCGGASHHVALPGSDHDAVMATVGPCR